MIKQIQQQPGQSIYDLCLMAYQSLDLLVKFCTDNNVTDLSNIPQQAFYSYDTTLVKNKGIVDFPFSTDSNFAANNRIFSDSFSLSFS